MAAGVLGALVTLSAQTQPPAVPKSPDVPTKPTFAVQINLVTTDIIARDANGQFVPDLTKGDIEVFEDGVAQEVACSRSCTADA
jgi:hypothetical protein